MEFQDDVDGERSSAGSQNGPDDARDGEPARRDMAAAVVHELEVLYRESYGGGAGQVSAEFVGENALVCFLEDLEFLPHERFLIESGGEGQLIRTRHDFEQAIEATFRAAVERATGRMVRTFNSVTNIEPPVAIEIFMFEPEMSRATRQG